MVVIDVDDDVHVFPLLLPHSGTGSSTASRPEMTKAFWEYIKVSGAWTASATHIRMPPPAMIVWDGSDARTILTSTSRCHNLPFILFPKVNELKDPADKRFVLCDDTLRALFKTERLLAFGAAKYIEAHIIKT